MITLRINGEEHSTADARRNLLSFIRFDAGLTGTKYGCGEGLCGACTVLVDGQVVRSCQTTVGAVAGGEIRAKAELHEQNDFIPWKRGVSL